MTYLITFCCYGSLVPGEGGYVSKRNNRVGARHEGPSGSLACAARAVTEERVELDSERRGIVLRAMVEVCRYRDWGLLAAHVRTKHVHVVVAAECLPERVMHDLKSYCSRALGAKKVWARHGSTLYLWTPEAVANAVRYVVLKQGAAMAVYP